MTPAMVLEVLGICSPGIFSLGWIVGRDWDALAFRKAATLPTARALRKSRLQLPGDRVWRAK